MKIALIDPSLFTWPYDSALAKGLRERGHEVVIYGKYLAEGEPGKHAPDYRELFYPGFQCAKIQALPKPLFLALKGVMHPFSLMRLLRELRRFRPDIIHFQWAPLPAVDRLFIPAFQRMAPTVFTVHDSTPFNNNPGSGLQRFGSITIMQRFDRLIVHTEQAQKRLIAYSIPPERIVRIPHGALDADSIEPAPALETRSGEDRPVTLLLFGKLKPYKGADVLIRALAAMPSSARERCRLHIVGKPYMDTQPLMELAKQLNVERNIIWDLRFVGEAEMAGIFAQADIIVMPYREIDASGVLMVALAMGRPIVASRIGLFAEMLEDGKHGYLIPPEDEKGLAAALTTLVDDNGARVRMGGQVRALMDSIPGWNAIAGMTEELYMQMRALHSKAE